MDNGYMAQKKRETKAQREARQKKELRLRVADIATGAAGYEFDSSGEFATAPFLERFVCALRCRFGNDKNNYLWQAHCLAYWETIDTATNALWDHGVRS